jgi:hypothetical protein
LLHSEELIGKSQQEMSCFNNNIAGNVYCTARPGMPRMLHSLKRHGRHEKHKTAQKSCKLATGKETENSRSFKAEEKMDATPTPFSGPPLFRHTPFLRVSKILTSR